MENNSGSETSNVPKERKIRKICKCGKQFYGRSTYYRHRKICTAAENLREVRSFLCKEEGCNFKSTLSGIFIKHLLDAHQIEMAEDVKVFKEYSEFQIWKEEFEKQTKAAYILRSTTKSLTGRTEYFYCNRSGSYISRSNRKRALKSQGLTKIGFSCPASLKVQVEQESEKVIAIIRGLHYGHDKQLFHLRIPKSDRQTIASQLSQGVLWSDILQNLCSGEVAEVERKHLCTRRDFHNISKSYGIEKSADIHLNVDAYVEKNLQKERNIILYKRQEDDVLYYPKDKPCPLERNDFALGIMTNFQKKMLQQFGNNIVCLDTTHGTNSDDFNIITVLVIDECSEGVPIAWLISNKITSVTLTLFFNQIRKEVGNIYTVTFMSDKTSQYFNIWKEVFQGKTKKLLCHWHVQRDWQKQLNKIKEKDCAAAIYKALCQLLEESDKNKFEKLLQKTCEQLEENSNTEEFCWYFQSEWVGIKEEWGKCFRVDYDINSNMLLESIKNLKYGECYLREKQGRKVGKCLSFLLKISHDIASKRIIKLDKEKNNWKIAEINKQHKSAMEMPVPLIHKSSEITWEVESEKVICTDTFVPDTLVYKIKKWPPCKSNCKIKCQPCDICLHSYTCNCPDGLTGTNICKHIHLVVRSEEEMAESYDDMYDQISEDTFDNIQDQITEGTFDNIQDQISKNTFDNIQDQISEDTFDNIQDQISEDTFDNIQDQISEDTFDNIQDQNHILQNANYFDRESTNPEDKDIETLRKHLLKQNMQIYKQIKICNNRTALLTAKEHLKNANFILELSSNSVNSIEIT